MTQNKKIKNKTQSKKSAEKRIEKRRENADVMIISDDGGRRSLRPPTESYDDDNKK